MELNLIQHCLSLILSALGRGGGGGGSEEWRRSNSWIDVVTNATHRNTWLKPVYKLHTFYRPYQIRRDTLDQKCLLFCSSTRAGSKELLKDSYSTIKEASDVSLSLYHWNTPFLCVLLQKITKESAWAEWNGCHTWGKSTKTNSHRWSQTFRNNPLISKISFNF